MRKTALLFAGQGAQTPGMGLDLYTSSPAARRIYDLGETIRPGTLDICFRGDKETLSRTEHTQPCLFLTDLACAYALTEAGIPIDGVAGFSLGEIAALAFVGLLSEADAFRLVTLRGEAMATCARHHPGGMAAVLKLSDEAVEDIAAGFEGIWPVNYNCPGQVVCAGDAQQIAPFSAAVKAAGGRALPLAVSGAFHTPYMDEASQTLRHALADLPIGKPTLPLWANLTGQCYPSDADWVRDTIAAQASSSVRWADILRDLYRQDYDTFIEVGAGRTLSGFVTKTLPPVTVASVTDLASLQATLSVLRDA